MVKSGTISTMPPIETVSSVSTRSRIAFFSMTSWRRIMGRSSIRRLSNGTRRRRGLAAHGAREVVDHQHRTDQEQSAAERPRDVKGMHRRDGLDEGVLQEAQLVVGAPHQALQDARHPHGYDVEDNAERADPVVIFDQALRIE